MTRTAVRDASSQTLNVPYILGSEQTDDRLECDACVIA